MSKSRRKKIEGWLGAKALVGAQRWLMKRTPADADSLGAKFGRLLFRVAKKRRERALANLRLAFPDKTSEELLQICKRTFEHFGRMSADFLTGRRFSDTEITASCSVEGLEHLDNALAKGNGVLVITAHFGNWERLSRWLTIGGYKLSVVARSTRSEEQNKLVNAIRNDGGAEVIPRGTAAKPILEKLKANELVGILPDQNADDAFIPFFGHPAGTVLGPGVISSRTGAPLIPAWCTYLGDGRYQIVFEPEIEPLPGFETRGEGHMRAIHERMEAVIREYPEQWLWFHDRWRNARKKGLVP